MQSQTVIRFPITNPRHDYGLWLSWAECELAILGYDLAEAAYDWKASFAEGLRPEEAAGRAAALIEQRRSE
jgi:hypothetical protein